MRKRSVKVKITLWYLLLMGLMAGLMLVFLRLISGSVYTQSAMEQLDQTVRENLGQVTLVDGRPQMGEGFQFYENGVYTLVYSQDKTLLAGQVPVAFTAAEPFHNGLTRLVDTDTGQYYVLDFWVPAGWDEGLWVRGLLEVPGRGPEHARPAVGGRGVPPPVPSAGRGGGVLDRPTGLPAPGTHHRHRRRHQPGLRSVRPGGGASRRQRVQPAGCHLQPDVCPAGAVLRGRDPVHRRRLP